MAYGDHFKLADDFIAHLDKSMGGIHDQFLRARYTGFVAVSAVTVYELAIREIFISFGERKHKVLGNFARRHFERLNGQIGRDRLQDRYLPLFGDKYATKFKAALERKEFTTLRSSGVSIKASYANVLTWRNGFAHEGTIPSTATYDEVRMAYMTGRLLIDCLAESLRR